MATRDLTEPDLPATARARPRALRTGWTTGTCATAATRAALALLVDGTPPATVEVALPSGRRVAFPVEDCTWLQDDTTEAVVVKDAGDDPDVTDRAHLTATVAWADAPGVHLWGGDGVGTVTRPGLGLEVGAPAINATPRAMIEATVAEAIDPEARGLDVVISVPDGERMARRTTNRRLGILGGISILGTTGIVRPFSTASWRASVLQAIDVMAAERVPTCVLSTGGRTEKAAMGLRPDLPQVAFVEVGDFTGAAVTRCVERGLDDVLFVGMAGKLAKLGAGVMMTHYTRSTVDTAYLAEVTVRAGGDDAVVDGIRGANTGRHTYEQWAAAGLLADAGAHLCTDVADNLRRWALEQGADRFAVSAVLVDFEGRAAVAASPGAGVSVTASGVGDG